MNRNTRDFEPGRVIAPGDEVDEHVLPQQAVHVEHKGEHERGGERDQHVRPFNAFLAGRREHPLAELEAEQDDAEVEDGLHHHMRRERRPAERRAQRPAQDEAIEGRQNAGDHRAGQRAASQEIAGERLPATLQGPPFSIGGAQRGRERGHPENVPVRLLQSGKHHRRAVALA